MLAAQLARAVALLEGGSLSSSDPEAPQALRRAIDARVGAAAWAAAEAGAAAPGGAAAKATGAGAAAEATGTGAAAEATRAGAAAGAGVELVFAGIVAAYTCVWVAAAAALGVAAPIDVRLFPVYYATFGFVFLWYTSIAAVVLRGRVRSGAAERPADLRRRGAAAAFVFFLAATFGAVFSSAKASIPEIQPFVWDVRLMRIDQLLHGGDPWVRLHPLLGHALPTTVLDFVYSPVWFAATAAFMGWVAWHGDSRLRLRFFVAYAMTWILLGNVLATVFSSAGPAYWADVVGGADPFAPLMTYLRDAAPRTVATQMELWAAQTGAIAAPSLGVSAAPSLHVATPALFAMIAWPSYRRLSFLLWGFTFLVLVATVHLGWHYAVDGYMGIAGAAGVLWLTDRLIVRRLPSSQHDRRDADDVAAGGGHVEGDRLDPRLDAERGE